MTTLDPKKLSVLAGGRYITGFAADGVFTIVHEADAVTKVVGVQGDVEMTDSADDSAVVTLTLMASSPSVAYFRELAVRRQAFELLVSDQNDSDPLTLHADGCRVQKVPDKAGGASATVSVAIIVPKVEYR